MNGGGRKVQGACNHERREECEVLSGEFEFFKGGGGGLEVLKQEVVSLKGYE